jgi:hypothetical protein
LLETFNVTTIAKSSYLARIKCISKMNNLTIYTQKIRGIQWTCIETERRILADDIGGGKYEKRMRRPCIFTPIHSLTGPKGQPFASRLGGQRFVS